MNAKDLRPPMTTLGYKHSAESKAKMSAHARLRYEDPAERAKTRGELSGTWKGDDIGHDAAHLRHRKVLPKVCAHADETCKGRLECAFRHDAPAEFVKIDDSGRRYSTRPEDYLRLCDSHHKRYDKPSSPAWSPTPRTLNAVYAARVCRGEGVSDGTADHLPVPSGDATAFYPDHGLQELHAEMVRLSQVLQARGAVA